MKKLLILIFVTTILSCFPTDIFAQKSIFGDVVEYDKSETAKKAKRKLAENDVPGAVKILDQAIEKNKDLFEAYRTRSFIRHFYKDDIDGAISDLDKAIEVKPDDVDIYLSRASLKKRYKKDFDGALKDYETAQKYHPNSSLFYRLKADVKIALKDFDGATAEIDAALKTQPENIDLHIYQTDVFLLKNELDKAVDYLQKFLKDYSAQKDGKLPKIRGEKVKKKIPSEFNNPDDLLNAVPVKRYSQMTFSVNSARDLREQQAEIDEARSLSKAFLLLGDMLISKGMFDDAFVKLNTSLEIDRNQEQAYALRGILYLNQDQTEKAIAEFSDAIDIVDDPAFYLNRGTAYLLAGNDKKSQKDFDNFLKFYPDKQYGQVILEQRIAEANKKIQEKSNNPK